MAAGNAFLKNGGSAITVMLAGRRSRAAKY